MGAPGGLVVSFITYVYVLTVYAVGDFFYDRRGAGSWLVLKSVIRNQCSMQQEVTLSLNLQIKLPMNDNTGQAITAAKKHLEQYNKKNRTKFVLQSAEVGLTDDDYVKNTLTIKICARFSEPLKKNYEQEKQFGGTQGASDFGYVFKKPGKEWKTFIHGSSTWFDIKFPEFRIL
jgi:hypothetical protein